MRLNYTTIFTSFNILVFLNEAYKGNFLAAFLIGAAIIFIEFIGGDDDEQISL